MTRTVKLVYYRRARYGGRFWNWTRKVEKRATPLRRMWTKKETVVSNCTALVPIKPAPIAVIKPAPMVLVNNLSGANVIYLAYAGQMAG